MLLTLQPQVSLAISSQVDDRRMVMADGEIVPDDAWIELPPANADLRYHGVDTNMSRLIAAHPRIGERFAALFLETMFGEGVLAYEERELVAGVTAAAQDCFY
jgi:hypothetical protein